MKYILSKMSVVLLATMSVGCAATKVAETPTIELNDEIRFTIPEGFAVSNGPNVLDSDKMDANQALLSIAYPSNQLVCQVSANVYASDPGESIARSQTLEDRKSMDIDDVKSINAKVDGVEVLSSYTQSSGVDLTFLTHAFYRSSLDTVSDKAQVYQIFCASETDSFERFESVVRQFLRSIEWL